MVSYAAAFARDGAARREDREGHGNIRVQEYRPTNGPPSAAAARPRTGHQDID